MKIPGSVRERVRRGSCCFTCSEFQVIRSPLVPCNLYECYIPCACAYTIYCILMQPVCMLYSSGSIYTIYMSGGVLYLLFSFQLMSSYLFSVSIYYATVYTIPGQYADCPANSREQKILTMHRIQEHTTRNQECQN